MNQDYREIVGISFSENGKIINNPDKPIPNLNSFPSLPYNLIDIENFFIETNSKTLHYISSRGCPHQCGFCADYVIYQRRWNPLSAERVLSDLEMLKEKYNYDFARFYDSNLFVDEKRIRKICEGIIAKKLNFKWIKCNGDAKVLSKYSSETLKLMNEAGVANILLGVESGYQPALNCIQKAAGIKENLTAAEKLHENNISIGFSFMFGFPYDLPKEKMLEEHKKELQATMETIANLSKNYLVGDYYLSFIFTPYPGVRLYSRYKDLGYQPPDSFEAWGDVNLNETNSCPWLSDDLLKLHSQSLKFNWFFMHKLARNIFWNKKNTALRKFAEICDDMVCRYLQRRIIKSKLSLPYILELIWAYYMFKGSIIMRGWKSSILRVKSVLTSRLAQ
jgi:anaerobic magnesium-protoporphyrin IX monomethyl ester cyclase